MAHCTIPGSLLRCSSSSGVLGLKWLQFATKCRGPASPISTEDAGGPRVACRKHAPPLHWIRLRSFTGFCSVQKQEHVLCIGKGFLVYFVG